MDFRKNNLSYRTWEKIYSINDSKRKLLMAIMIGLPMLFLEIQKCDLWIIPIIVLLASKFHYECFRDKNF